MATDAQALPTEISQEHLLTFLLLDKERERATTAAKLADTERQLVVNSLNVLAENYRVLYRMGANDKLEPATGKIVRAEAKPALQSVPQASKEGESA